MLRQLEVGESFLDPRLATAPLDWCRTPVPLHGELDRDVALPLTPMTSAAFMVFTLYMIPDPATTPVKPLQQVLFGIAIAAVYGMLLVSHMVYGLFIALAIVCALRGVGLNAWAAWQSHRTNQRGSPVLQPGIAGNAK